MSRRRRLHPERHDDSEDEDRAHRSRSREPGVPARWDQEDDGIDEDEFDPVELEDWNDRVGRRGPREDEDDDPDRDPLSW